MCNFLSAIVLKNGDILCAPEYTDSHEDLIQHFNLQDNEMSKYLERFCRIEFVPPKGMVGISNLSNWVLNVDEQETPSWFDKEKVRNSMESLVRDHIISDNRKFLLGGWWILVGNAVIEISKSSQVKMMCDSSQVNKMCDSSQAAKNPINDYRKK